MKKTAFISVIILLVLIMAGTNITAQVPAFFNYQAVIKDANHNPLTDVQVSFRFTIWQDSESGTDIYTETQSATSDAQGRIALKVGDGDPLKGSMEDIHWGNHSYFLEVEMDPDNGSDYKSMGTQQLVAVPYAMHAGSVDMPVEGLEIVEPDGQDPEAALFEVKRSDGSIVFAVYNEGVRIFVDDSNGKGIKGGFAVGGYNSSTKGYSNEYLRVTPDSVRIYIDQSQSKGSKGGFAVGGYSDDTKDTPVDFMYLTPDNYFIGHASGVNNTTGFYNTFLGYKAGHANTSGGHNVFMGFSSGYSNTSGYNNIFLGNSAGYENKNGYNNIFLGNDAGCLNDSASLNVFIGNGAGYSNTNGEENIFIGNQAGHNNNKGFQNTMIGGVTGWHNSTGSRNTFIGIHSGNLNISGDENVFLGAAAGHGNLTGSYNVAVGPGAGHHNEDGFYNVFLGFEAGYHETGSSKLYIENSNAGEGEALIYGDFGSDLLQFNAEVTIRDAMILNPRYDVPEDPIPGMLYFDGNDNTLKAYDGTTWHALW